MARLLIKPEAIQVRQDSRAPAFECRGLRITFMKFFLMTSRLRRHLRATNLLRTSIYSYRSTYWTAHFVTIVTISIPTLTPLLYEAPLSRIISDILDYDWMAFWLCSLCVCIFKWPVFIELLHETHAATEKQHDNTKTPPKTSITQRLRTVSWSNDSQPTGVVKQVYGIPTFPLTAKVM